MSIILGLDIGSSSCKASLVQIDCPDSWTIVKKCITSYKLTRLSGDPDKWEVPVNIILNAIEKSLLGLQLVDFEGQITSLAVTGQMHGCVLWNERPWIYDIGNQSYSINDDFAKISNLISWQDQRCSTDFLSTLPETNRQIASGYGVASIFWLHRYEPSYLNQFTQTGTIMDFLITMICGLDKPVMTSHNAVSFGYYDDKSNNWSNKLSESNFPTNILPKIVKIGDVAGNLLNNWVGLPKNIAVYAAFGDLQCSTFSCIQNEPKTAVLTMSTSLQLVVNPSYDVSPTEKALDMEKILILPYVYDQFIIAAASLNGGNVLEAVVNFICDLIKNLTDIEANRELIWSRLTKSSVNHDEISDNNNNDETPMEFISTLFGERHSPQLKANLLNICPGLTINKLFKVICQGLIDNIFNFIPIDWLKAQEIKQIKATGGALLRNQFIKSCLENRLSKSGILVDYLKETDAQIGAALMVAMFERKFKK